VKNTGVSKIILHRLLLLALLSIMLAGCDNAQITTQQQTKAQEPAAQQVAAATPVCAKESLPSLPDVRITSVTQESAPVPHCKVAGVIGPEIHFELLLPETWNGKFVFGGGGGFGGVIINWAQDVLGALQKGYATVGTDTGHQANGADASWALNNLERLENFGHQAVHRTAANAKALTEAYYGAVISHEAISWVARAEVDKR